MKLGGKTMALGGLALLTLGAGAWAYNRRLHTLALIPEAPSRAMSHEPVTPEPAADSLRVLYVGHSLISEDIPRATAQIAESLGVEWSYDLQLTWGGSMQANWNRAEEMEKGRPYDGVDARRALREGEYDVLLMTEAVNIDDHVRWSDPPHYLNLWYDLAVESQGDDLRVFLYEGWDRRDKPRKLEFFQLPGDWASHTRRDLKKWEYIVDAGRAERRRAHPDGPEVSIIPGGQALVTLVEEARTGQLPHVGGAQELFEDGVHPSALGSYFMALVHFATVARRSPVGATNEVDDSKGTHHVLQPETATKMQQVAWEVVQRYPRQGFTPR